jgi:peptidoglycan/xylan/chitin deacetylase (PgdA/CDA1 family)
MVALTFDMGGRLDPALDILQWLIDRDVEATIFPTGRTATQTTEGRAALDLVAAHRERFDVGNHSWSHPDFRELDAEAMRSQLAMTDAAIVAAVNLDTKPWFRPPFGGLDDQVPAVVGPAGWSYVVMWDIDTIDWRPVSDGGPTAEAIVAKVLDRVDGGSIVLMHLGGFNTFDALPGIMHGLAERGLRPVTLSEMFGEG